MLTDGTVRSKQVWYQPNPGSSCLIFPWGHRLLLADHCSRGCGWIHGNESRNAQTQGKLLVKKKKGLKPTQWHLAKVLPPRYTSMTPNHESTTRGEYGGRTRGWDSFGCRPGFHICCCVDHINPTTLSKRRRDSCCSDSSGSSRGPHWAP